MIQVISCKIPTIQLFGKPLQNVFVLCNKGRILIVSNNGTVMEFDSQEPFATPFDVLKSIKLGMVIKVIYRFVL